jgi:hypothetical protein
MMKIVTGDNGPMSHYKPEKSLRTEPSAPPLESALARLMAEIHEGLRHGHFKMGITCEVVSAGRRSLVVESGRTYRFLIAEAELQK